MKNLITTLGLILICLLCNGQSAISDRESCLGAIDRKSSQVYKNIEEKWYAYSDNPKAVMLACADHCPRYYCRIHHKQCTNQCNCINGYKDEIKKAEAKFESMRTECEKRSAKVIKEQNDAQKEKEIIDQIKITNAIEQNKSNKIPKNNSKNDSYFGFYKLVKVQGNSELYITDILDLKEINNTLCPSLDINLGNINLEGFNIGNLRYCVTDWMENKIRTSYDSQLGNMPWEFFVDKKEDCSINCFYSYDEIKILYDKFLALRPDAIILHKD